MNISFMMELISKTDILIIYCCTKPYEFLHAQRMLTAFEANTTFILCRGTVKDTYASYLKFGCHQVLFMEYQPKLFDGIWYSL